MLETEKMQQKPNKNYERKEILNLIKETTDKLWQLDKKELVVLLFMCTLDLNEQKMFLNLIICVNK